MQTRDTVVAVFDERDDAQDAINALRDAGFLADDISILARDRDTAGRLADDTGTEAATGAATGALAGGLLGGVAGWLVGIGALAIPGVGPIIAAGPIAAALGGAAIGATTGGIIGALTGAGIPEDEARYYDTEFRRGGIVVTVQARGRFDEARDILRENGGRDTESTSTAYSSWNETAPRFRTSYENRYGASRRWEDVEPAHRFGYESYGRMRTGDMRADYRNAEPTLRQEWTRSGITGDYDTHRNDVRRGWDYGRGRTNFNDYDRDTGTEGENTAATAGGALAGGAAGGVAGAAIGGPVGLAAGAAIGGTAGAMAGDAAVETPDERRRDRDADRRDRLNDDTSRRR
ncbi:MAG: general stress protein [Chloroflexi bacterium]|nr:general stress protein [Chloroflexota bacterium]